MYYVSILRRLSPSGSIRVYQVLCSFLRVYKAPRNSKEIPPLKLFSGVGHSLRRLVRFMERDDCNRQFVSLFLLVLALRKPLFSLSNQDETNELVPQYHAQQN